MIVGQCSPSLQTRGHRRLEYRPARESFLHLFSALVVPSATLALIPNVPVMKLLVGVQVLNGILLPIVLVFILLLINDKRLTGDLKNKRRHNVLGVGTLILITTAVVVMMGSQLLELFGIQLFGTGQ